MNKLNLSRETLRLLSPDHARHVAGAISDTLDGDTDLISKAPSKARTCPTWACPSNYCESRVC